MHRSLWLALLLALALSTTAFAQGKSQGKGHGKGNSQAQKVEHGNGNAHNDDYDRGNGNRRDDDHLWDRRGDWEYRTYDGGQQPPGFSKGKKTGWGNCDLPPGQAKKYGCNTYRWGGRTHYWYQDNQGRIVVRRPVITIGVH